MAKITQYKVKCKIIRQGFDDVKIELDDSNREFKGSQDISIEDSKAIPNIAKDLADFNEKQKLIKIKTLMKSEQEAESFIILKYLEE